MSEHNHQYEHDHKTHADHVHHENCACHAEEHKPLGAIHVESHLHDEARVISGSLALFTDYGKLKLVLSDQLELLAKAVQARGGIVGHIKASVEIKQIEMFSVTDVDVAVKTAPSQEIHINMASIVFAIDAKEAAMLVSNALEAVKTGA